MSFIFSILLSIDLTKANLADLGDKFLWRSFLMFVTNCPPDPTQRKTFQAHKTYKARQTFWATYFAW